MDIRVVGAVTGYGGAAAAVLSFVFWPTVFLILGISLLSASLTLWAVLWGWIR